MKSTLTGPGPRITLKGPFCRLSPQNRLLKVACPLIGLTGQVATGKSQVAKILQQKGLAVIVADILIKELYQQEETLNFIHSLAPHCFKGKALDFSLLREFFFDGPENQRAIEQFLHPKVAAQFMKHYKSLGPLGALVYDVPLLFEKGLHHQVDLRVTVSCPSELQKERLMRRDAIGPELAQKMISQQMGLEQKEKLSDYVIDNSRDFPHLEREAQKFWDTHLTKAPSP